MTTISGAGAHGAAAGTDRLPASKDGNKGYLTAAMLLAYMRGELMADTGFVDAVSSLSDAMVFKGVIDCSANPNYPAANRGATYRVSVAGKIGGASGPSVDAGDLLTCLTDSTASGNHATVGSAWTITEHNLDGAVIGVASSLDGEIALFDSTTGKLLKRGATVPAAIKSQTYALSYGGAARSNDSRWGFQVDMREFAGAGTDVQVLQAAIDYAATGVAAAPATTPATVRLPAGRLALGDKVVLKDRVILAGEGKQATELFASNALNKNIIETPNFSSLTGQNKWDAADGVVSFVGLVGFRLNGNKANQSSGHGAALYAKGLILDLLIDGAKDCGLYTEAGHSPSVSTWDTLPEGNARHVEIINCGSHGWHNRGPHDLYAEKITSAINGGDGMRIESLAATYLATCDIGQIHCYANTGKGLYIKSSALIKAAIARLEDNYEEGLVLESATHCGFGQAFISDNCRTSGSYQVDIDTNSNFNQIRGLNCRDQGRVACGGVRINGGDENFIQGRIRGNVYGAGTFSTSVGLDIAAGALRNVCDIILRDFVGTAGIGLRLGQSSAVNHNHVRGQIYNCETLLNNANVGAFNRLELNGYTNTTALAGSNQGPDDDWNVDFNQNGTKVSAECGTYTPTLTGVANVASSTPAVCRWTRRGNQVTITGSLSVTGTAAVATYIGVSLPPTQTSNFSGSADATGVCSCDDAQQSGNVSADSTNDRIQLGFVAANTSAHTMMFMAQYTVKT